MAEYGFQEIEKKWQKSWKESELYKVPNTSNKPKYYILDMFPYPSGAGLHVGHPLGYIASDIVARYKRLKGFNVLHPMGFDSFGLPAEQYAIQTGQHPALTTEQNITRYKEQLKSLGFSYDWSREVRTSDPKFYKWTQWIFKLIYNSWYNTDADKAEPIDSLISILDKEGNANINATCDEDTPIISSADWNGFSEKEKQQFLLKYRLTYLAETTVNWCPALGTVLSNDEVKDCFSERGGHPVVKKKMPQWSMRITAYCDRLLNGLDTIDWPEPIKEMQRNWIGKSTGCEVRFSLNPSPSPKEKGEDGVPGWQTADKSVAHILKKFARENRKDPTAQEDQLWQAFRNKQTGFKVRRQHAIDTFIVDFVFLKEKLIVEVDGLYHEKPDQKEYDKARTKHLNDLGYEVMVIKNAEVDDNLSEVVTKIKQRLEQGQNDFQSEVTPSPLENGTGVEAITTFTTRIDTIYGATFLVLAPEHELVEQLTTSDQKAEVEAYVKEAINRSERERMSDVKTVSGVFSGSYAINPFNNEQIPIWIADYVLAGYGTGAVMAVPAHDERDHRFAKKFGLEILQVIDGDTDVQEEAFTSKDAKVVNSDFMNDLTANEAIQKGTEYAVEKGFGEAKINFRLRDAIFGRQRYWGEPMPLFYKDGVPQLVEDDALPLKLPPVDEYLPTEDGDPPLGRAKDWNHSGDSYELSTMPGWAGSSWYFFRYMDPDNEEEFASKEAMDYWQDVDFYMGGSEHATGHLLYSRFWTKFLYDLGYVKVEEYAKKLVNQGMILGRSNYIVRYIVGGPRGGEPVETNSGITLLKNVKFEFVKTNVYLSLGIAKRVNQEELFPDQLVELLEQQFGSKFTNRYPEFESPTMITDNVVDNYIDIKYVNNDILNIEMASKDSRYENSYFLKEDDGKFHCGVIDNEKMSKSKYNVVNPDDLVEKYGADTLRMYEMFLGPIEQSKPWNTNGIEGVFKFLRKFWNLFHEEDSFKVSDDDPTKEELKTLHGLIKKVEWDCEHLSLNTSVSAFMIAVNELGSAKCNKRAILEPMTILLSPFAPHLAEELWSQLGHDTSVVDAPFPIWDEKHLVEDSFEYPVSINGKMRIKLSFGLDISKEDIEREVLANETVQKWTEGKLPKKVIVVPKRIVNVV
ncbi:MAG: leucine--tRNA ligase, partial [Cytophagales bacterium]|nr:leucine--tRNA ligase [Cytophagales bacterium]